jgi:hypothetical protein
MGFYTLYMPSVNSSMATPVLSKMIKDGKIEKIEPYNNLENECFFLFHGRAFLGRFRLYL